MVKFRLKPPLKKVKSFEDIFPIKPLMKINGRDKAYLSPRWSYQILESKMPVSFDQYNRCGFDCLYCFAYFQKSLKCLNSTMGDSKNYRDETPSCINLRTVWNTFNNKESQFYPYLNKGYIFQWGGLADPFCPFEKKYGVGLNVMKILDHFKQPVSFCTKGVWWIKEPEYISLFKKNSNWRMQFSIVTNDDDISKKLERGAPSTTERLEGMKTFLEQTGRPVTLRLRPFIIGLTDNDDGHLKLIKRAHAAGCRRVSIEWLCIESRLAPGVMERYNKISALAGMDIFKFYKRNSEAKSGYLRLNATTKWDYGKKIVQLCEELGMVIYFSDSMLKDQSRNFTKDKKDDFLPENYFNGQFSYALQLAIRRSTFDKTDKLITAGKVFWKDIAEEMGILNKFKFRYALGLNTRGVAYRSKRWWQTMAEWLQEKWNNPNDPSGPTHHFHGQLYPGGLDEYENVWYYYVQREFLKK